MNWREALNRFHLHYDYMFDQEVDAISAIELVSSVRQRQRLLTFDSEASLQ